MDQATPASNPITPEPRPYWLRYAGHLVEFGTLSPPMRRMAKIATIAALVGLLFLTLPLTRLPAVGFPASAHMRLPDIVLIVGTVLQLAGWWYLLAGSHSASGALRWPVAIAFLVFQLDALSVSRLVLLSMVLTVAYTIFASFRRVTDAWNLAISAAIVLLYYLGALTAGSAALFGMLTLSQVGTFYLVFLPVIFYSGFDLGETGLFFTRLGLWHLHPRISAGAVWWIGIAVVAAKFAWFAFYWQGISWNVLIALGVLAAGALLTNVLATLAEPPELLPFAFSLLVFGALLGTAGTDLVWSGAAFLSLIVGIVLAVGARHRKRLAAAAVFLILFGLWNLFSISDRAGSPLYALGITAITEPALDWAITIAATLYLVYLRLRGQIRVERVILVVFWMVGFTLILGTWNLLESLHSLSHGLITAEALLLLIGMAHEIAASGGMLNRGSKALPRTSRVLLYLGYLLMLSGATVLAAGTDGAISGLADIDTFQQGGLLLIGVPLFLQQFLHAFAFGHRGHPVEEEEGEGAPA